MATIKASDKDAFTAYVNSIKTTLSPEQKTVSGAAKLYEEWKAKQTPVQTTQKVNTPKEGHITTTAKGTFIYQGGKYIPYTPPTKVISDTQKKAEELKKEQDALNKTTVIKDEAQKASTGTQAFIDKGAMGSGDNGSSVYQNSMNTAIQNIKDKGESYLGELNTELQETAKRKEEVLKGINDKASDAYNNSTKEFLDLIDQNTKEIKLSIDAQRRITDSLREAAGVESLVANAKALPGLSNDQRQALSKDIAMGYQTAIAQAEGNYELARLAGWDKIKALGIDGKNAMDILTGLNKSLSMEVAEPVLTALAQQSTNKTDFIKRVNELLLGTQTKAYGESEEKQLTQQANLEREMNWKKSSLDERRVQLYQNLSSEGITLTVDPKITEKILNEYESWSTVRSMIGWLQDLDSTKRALIIQAIGKDNVSLDEALGELNKTGIVSSEDLTKLAKGGGNVGSQYSVVDGGYKTPTTSEINTMEAKPDQAKVDALEAKTVENKLKQNAAYDEIINKLSTSNKAILDKTKIAAGDKKQKAIDTIKNSNYPQSTKEAMIYYITK